MLLVCLVASRTLQTPLYCSLCSISPCALIIIVFSCSGSGSLFLALKHWRDLNTTLVHLCMRTAQSRARTTRKRKRCGTTNEVDRQPNATQSKPQRLKAGYKERNANAECCRGMNQGEARRERKAIHLLSNSHAFSLALTHVLFNCCLHTIRVNHFNSPAQAWRCCCEQIGADCRVEFEMNWFELQSVGDSNSVRGQEKDANASDKRRDNCCLAPNNKPLNVTQSDWTSNIG